MWAALTPEVIGSAITGLFFALAGIGVYSRTKSTAPKLDGAYKVESEWAEVSRQLERIAQAAEDLVASNKDSFQRDVRDRFARLEEVLEHQAEADRIKDALTRAGVDPMRRNQEGGL